MISNRAEIITVKQALARFDGYEWYDNTRLNVIQSCHRKGFYNLVGPWGTPLALKVGDAADFGSTFHAGIAHYRDKHFSKLPYANRLVKAATGFNHKWQQKFANKTADVDNKYKLGRGIQQLVLYCDKWRSEDEFYDIIESELAFAILVKPRNGEKFKPFVFQGKIDWVAKRLTMQDVIVGELKTCAGDPSRRLKEMHLDRQTQGYYKALEYMEAGKVGGVLLDAVQISAQKITDDIFARDFVSLNEADGEMWRSETIGIVEQWRALVARGLALSVGKAGNHLVLANFDRRTSECTTYGLCPFYDLCLFGITHDSMSQFAPNTWSPLNDEEAMVEVLET